MMESTKHQPGMTGTAKDHKTDKNRRGTAEEPQRNRRGTAEEPHFSHGIHSSSRRTPGSSSGSAAGGHPQLLQAQMKVEVPEDGPVHQHTDQYSRRA